MKEVIGYRFKACTGKGSLGFHTDTRFTRCFWPTLDQPTALFADGSSGLIVEGPPTPRNVIFPPDTIFAERTPDAEYAALMELKKTFPEVNSIIELTDEQAKVWRETHDKIASELPATAAKVETKSDVFYLSQKELISKPEEKAVYRQYIAELTTKEAMDINSGASDLETVKAEKQFIALDGSGDVLIKAAAPIAADKP